MGNQELAKRESEKVINQTNPKRQQRIMVSKQALPQNDSSFLNEEYTENEFDPVIIRNIDNVEKLRLNCKIRGLDTKKVSNKLNKLEFYRQWLIKYCGSTSSEPLFNDIYRTTLDYYDRDLKIYTVNEAKEILRSN